jgi:hypothetical protein
MRAQQAFENTAVAQAMALMKIGEILRSVYSVDDAPLPESLGTLLKQIESSEISTAAVSSKFKPTCPRCQLTMVSVQLAPGLGGQPALGGYACPKCRYIDGGRMGVSGKHRLSSVPATRTCPGAR